MSGQLDGRRALIVGGTAGIGLATARAMLAEGAEVVIAGRNRDRGARALAALAAPGAAFIAADAGKADDCATLVEQAVGTLGGIDVLMSCGGGDPMPRLLRDIPLPELMPQVSAALAPVITPARAVLPVMAMQGSGTILCVASDAGKLATPGEVTIGAAMAAIIMFCRAMANEVKRDGIRVNCLTPSIVEGTPLHDRLMDDSFAGRLFSKAKSRADLGVVRPEDLAAMAVFLASDQAARITGQTISVTGGISAI
ncbi:MAG: SDR family oxidoreductase [Pararhodobacter sp.]|nr:SDR family oxidoreductase [Pararhodobacter sp.]